MNKVILSQSQILQKNTLCLKYPILKKYITQCFNENKTDELFEFLNGIELSENQVSN